MTRLFHPFIVGLLLGLLSAPVGAQDKEDAPPEEPVDPVIKKMRTEVDRIELERDKLQAENAIREARLAEELAERKAELERSKLALEEAARQLNATDEIAKLTAELERAELEAKISKARMDQRQHDLRKTEDELKNVVAQLRYEIEQKQQERERGNYADQQPVYLEDPLQGQTLIVSDRRIPLNGVITSKTADAISERINYYNNKSIDFPIFVVIDDSPGGSVMAGYKILKAMESSEAPVHVVVKSYAASMAAVITAMADRSFAYPNAILLQHQIRSGFSGNLTQQREELEETEEWWRRLASPLAGKMGVTLDELIARMYVEASTGDWDEFADDAKKLKWVDVIVNEIRETSLLRHPDATVKAESKPLPQPKTTAEPDENGLIETLDEAGRPICILPRINSHDRWWLFNRDGYYRSR